MRSQNLPRTTLISVPQQRFTLKTGRELLEECGPWQLCNRCGTTLFFQADDTISALACTLDWPAQDVEDLHQQAERGNYVKVRRLIHQGLPLEAKRDGWTPLMYAAGYGQTRACRVLLEHGAEVGTALGKAACGRSSAVLRLFLQHGADRQKLFVEVVLGGTVRDALAVYDPTVNVNLSDGEGVTPLYRAVQNSTAMVRFLLERGADTTLLPADKSPFTLCISLGKAGRLRALLTGGATQDLLEEALTTACDLGRFGCVRILLEAGANINQKDFTPLMAASRQGSLVLVNLLLERGADPRLQSERGKTAFDYAQPWVADLLASATASFLPDSKGRLQHRWTTNAAGEPCLKLRKRGITRQWTHCHAAIVERLSDV